MPATVVHVQDIPHVSRRIYLRIDGTDTWFVMTDPESLARFEPSLPRPEGRAGTLDGEDPDLPCHLRSTS